jgi:hypothetical protein
MRFVIIVLLGLPVSWSAPVAVLAEQANSCKQCSDQRRACMSNYSAKTCQIEHDRCMKECQRK